MLYNKKNYVFQPQIIFILMLIRCAVVLRFCVMCYTVTLTEYHIKLCVRHVSAKISVLPSKSIVVLEESDRVALSGTVSGC